MAKIRLKSGKHFAPYEPTENEEYMNEAQLEHFKNVLLMWKQKILDANTEVQHQLQDENSQLPDLADRASYEEDFSLRLRARDRDRKLIRKIEAALGRISIGEYGYCMRCGCEIGIRRLEARPTAELCIDCKELAERKEKNKKKRSRDD